MRKQTYILMIFGIAFHEKSSFSKKVHVRKPHDSCSRIGVCEGPPKKKEIKERGTIIKNLFKNRSRKRGDNEETTSKNHPKKEVKMKKEPSKNSPPGRLRPTGRVGIRRDLWFVCMHPILFVCIHPTFALHLSFF